MSTKKFLIGILIIVGVVVIALLLDYLASKTKNPYEPVPATISGQVHYLERIALLPGSVVEVSLLDTSLADAPATELAKVIKITEGENVPIPFSLTYNQRDIKENHSYSIRARIMVDGQLRWINTTNIPVITNGAPTENIDVLVQGATVSDTQTESVPLNGSTFKLINLNGEDIPLDSKLTVSFTDKTIQAKFCNNMTGAYDISNGNIKAMMASTLMLCQNPEYLMKAEDAFSKMMSAGAKLEQDGHILKLSDSTNTMTFQVFMD